jgi:alkylation response protein AidB-like acyl-CoA dehydrogenase
MRQGVRSDDVELADAVARFAASELAPHAAAIDEQQASVTRHIPKLGELGLMGMNVPERWGGAGVSAAGLLLSLVEVSKACAATSSMIGAHYLGTDALLIGANDEQRARYLPAAARGELLGAFALTEPGGGSNPAEMKTVAVRHGTGYRLRGSKQFISNAGEAGFIVVYAKTDAGASSKGVSAFIVDRGIPGVDIGPPEKLMGIRGAHAFGVRIDCEVPEERRLGDEGSGFRTAMRVLDNGRLDVAATALGIAEAALSAAVAWARERHIDGAPLATRQGIQWMIADMKTRLEAAWALTMHAVAMRAAGERFTQEAAVAKLYASEMVGFVADAALQMHGGYGYTRDLPLERYVRDARILRIYEGSSEIQRTIIARGVLGP